MLGEGMITYAVLAVLAVLVVFLLVQVFLLRSKLSALTRKYQYFMAGGERGQSGTPALGRADGAPGNDPFLRGYASSA